MILHLDSNDVYCLLDALLAQEDDLRELIRTECSSILENRYYTTINLYDRIIALKENGNSIL